MKNAFILWRAAVFCMLIIVAGALPASAANPSVHLSARPGWLSKYKDYDKRPSPRTIENGYYLSLFERQINVEQQADYRHVIRQIVSDAGIQNGSQISVSFDPSYEKLDFHEIIVWRDKKPLSRLNSVAFKVIADEQDLSKFIYQGSYTALCILNDIRKGDRIEYAYTVTGRNPIFSNKFCKDIYLQGSQLFAHEYISLLFSTQRSLHFKSFNKVPDPVISEKGGLKRYEWEDFQVPAVKDAETQPDWYNTYAHVQVTEFNNWGEVVDWALKVNPVPAQLKGDLAAEVARLKHEAGSDTAVYFRKAVETVQDEVRYMGIELGEYSHRANRPEKVFDQRYGDCKDKSLLLASMLRAGGIDASMVLLNTNAGARLDEFLPASNVFDHAIVVANFKGQLIWIDPTISYQRGSGTDIYHPDYGKGLVLRQGSSGLTGILSPKTGKTICQEVFTVKDEKSPVKMDVKTIYTLNEADRLRDRLASTGMAETEKNYLDYYSKIYARIESRDSVKVTDNEQKNKLQVDEAYVITDFFKKNPETGKYDVSFYANLINDLLPAVTNQTKTPVAVAYPNDFDYTIKVVLPGGWDIANADTVIKRDAYRLQANYFTNGDTLCLRYQLVYLKSFIPVDKLDEFKEDIKEMKDNWFSYSIAYTPHNMQAASARTNMWMVIYAFCLVGGLAGLGIWIYHRETPGIVFTYGSTFMPIGGWLVLIIIGLVLTPLSVLISMINGSHFSLNTWNLHGSGNLGTGHHIFLIYEATGNIVLLCYSIFCLVLLLNRRDILPNFIIGYFLLAAGFLICDYLFAYELTGPRIADKALIAMVRSIIIAAIWIPYFKRSTRVHDTFVVPHPADNYRYEEPGEAVEHHQ